MFKQLSMTANKMLFLDTEKKNWPELSKFHIMENKEKLRICSRLKETKKSLEINTMCDPILDLGPEKGQR